ncbi:preprotein translocase subunit SecA [Stutzerimonas stutzeri]|uniref:Preprotein translocase subunit SecA n=2 Tax=Stutzerimonas TaxID=2901164 RepID=I4CQ68_STUST|nr:preprotein translocase subunit SecA [Stutzerimonas stutzeri CCUG 29243]KKJ94954.1 preprotein translocase subunit SecA [Stutzerimonas stutzeri]MAK86283.1 ion transporter [Pseudomonas sp.]OCX96621.1 MAG: preprotein translocase subunit SecA [Pseudomonas sp. K35]OHC14980.1 MAG: preprotein translocase subunit SecA [Pseudomonadales bacterium GWC2_63_15]RRU93031.1 ion transporter [Stutzerimonas xanthomarina]
MARQARRRDQLHAAWEAFIVLLVCINLSLILFDSLFALQPVSAVLADLAPELHARYQQSVHANFQYIDLGFVAIFVLDVLLGWTVALFERRYARWYYYPFAHWYDVLGCIPLAGLRWLRVLRVGALLIRLQRLGLIDMRGWAIYGLFSRYYYLLIEELSDRVMVRLFGRLQQEIGASDDLSRRLLQEVVRPRKQRLLNDISRRLQDMLETGYRDNRGAIEGYVSQLIHQALQNNPEMHNLRRLPLGNRLASTLDDALSDIAARLLQGAVEGMRGPQFQALAGNLADEFFDAWVYQDENTDLALEELLVDVIEVLKQQVLDRRWSRFVGPTPPPTHPE